jgi:hypothetical protein
VFLPPGFLAPPLAAVVHSSCQQAPYLEFFSAGENGFFTAVIYIVRRSGCARGRERRAVGACVACSVQPWAYWARRAVVGASGRVVRALSVTPALTGRLNILPNDLSEVQGSQEANQ